MGMRSLPVLYVSVAKLCLGHTFQRKRSRIETIVITRKIGQNTLEYDHNFFAGAIFAFGDMEVLLLRLIPIVMRCELQRGSTTNMESQLVD